MSALTAQESDSIAILRRRLGLVEPPTIVSGQSRGWYDCVDVDWPTNKRRDVFLLTVRGLQNTVEGFQSVCRLESTPGTSRSNAKRLRAQVLKTLSAQWAIQDMTL